MWPSLPQLFSVLYCFPLAGPLSACLLCFCFHRMSQYEARRQRAWQEYKAEMYAEHDSVMSKIEMKKLPPAQEYVPQYEHVFSKPVGVTSRDRDSAPRIEF